MFICSSRAFHSRDRHSPKTFGAISYPMQDLENQPMAADEGCPPATASSTHVIPGNRASVRPPV